MTDPSGILVESQENVYGAAVMLASLVPLTITSTRATPTLSLALTVIGTVPFSVLPAAGEVMLTVGCSVSGTVLDTATDCIADPMLPLVS